MEELQQKNSFRLGLQEHDQVYIVVAELPGIARQHILIRLRDNGLLENPVDRMESGIPETERYLIRERGSSPVTRSLYLLHASAYGVSAELQGSLLYVVVPKVSYHGEPELEITVR